MCLSTVREEQEERLVLEAKAWATRGQELLAGRHRLIVHRAGGG